MKGLNDYLKEHEQSKTALIEFLNIRKERNNDKLEEWKNHYRGLYEKTSYGPTGLPIIAACNFDGIYFQYISTFHSLFEKSDYYYDPENVLMQYGLPLTLDDMKL